MMTGLYTMPCRVGRQIAWRRELWVFGRRVWHGKPRNDSEGKA